MPGRSRLTAARRRRLRAVAAAGAATLLGTACGTTVQTTAAGAPVGAAQGGIQAPGTADAGGLGGTTGGVAAPGTTGAAAVSGGSGGSSISGTTGGTTSTGTTGSAQGGTSGGAPVVETVNGHAPGVTATTVKIGFITIDPQSAATTTAAFGGNVANGGNPEDQVKAIVDHLNARGGLAGRKIIPVIQERDTSSNETDYGAQFCEKFTNDHKVFAVVTNYRIDEGVEACFAKRHTLFINDGVEPESVLTKIAKPYVWVPGLPSQEGGYAAYTEGLASQGYFTKTGKLGIVAHDTPDTLNAYKTVVQPRLAKYGYTGAKVEYFAVKQPENDADNGRWAQEIQGAMLKFRDRDVDRVMFMAPGAGVPILFMQQAQGQAYRPTYGLSSYDSPAFLLQKAVPATQLAGSMGGGFVPLVDSDPSKSDPFPTGKGETQCLEVMKKAGITFASRGEAYSAMYLCDGAFMLAAAAAPYVGKGLTTEGWAAAADRLGSSYQAGYAHPGGTFVAPGTFTGGNSYREFKYDTTCSCFYYTSGPKRIP